MPECDPGRRSSVGHHFLSFAPPLLLRRIAEGVPIEPREARYADAAAALIDVQGFSALAEEMCASGPYGMERLARVVNDCFGHLVESIERAGGDAHCFPGDAVVAVWPAIDISLAEAALRAATCALDVVSSSTNGRIPLRLKAGIGTGPVVIAHVGGECGRYELLLAGPALRAMGDAEKHAQAGQVVASEPAWRLVAEQAVARTIHPGWVVLESCAHDFPATGGVTTTGPVESTVIDIVRRYLPVGLVGRLDADQGDWLGEFRQLSVLFVRLVAPGAGTLPDVDRIDCWVRRVQRELDRYEGTLIRLAHDDKGVCALAAMGLPPWTHENDAERAVLAALAVHAGLAELGAECSVGVTSGRLYCGPIGAPARRDYSIVGTVANRAARLAAAQHAGVLCDPTTAALVGPGLQFESGGLPPTSPEDHQGDTLRPISVPSHRGTGGHLPPSVGGRGGRRTLPPSSRVFGRETELERAAAWLDGLSGSGDRVLVLRGEAGIGKSALLRATMPLARALGRLVLVGACDAQASLTAYYPWREILLKLLGLDGADVTISLAAARVRDLVRDETLAPLLGDVLGLDIPDSPITQALSGTVRRDNTLALVGRLLTGGGHAAEELPRLMAIEDGHWMDSASWALVDAVRRMDGPIGLVLTMRPEVDADPVAAEQLLGKPGVTLLDLGQLSSEATAELVQATVQVDHLMADVAAYVFRQTQGNPFFVEELLASLRESGELEIVDGVARLRAEAWDSADGSLPTSVRGVLTRRIDRLRVPVQLTLKAASIIGRQFNLRTLAAIHPQEEPVDVVRRHLDELTETDLIQRRSPVDDESFTFKHAITRDVTYGLMLFAHRRRLHQTLAEHLEASGGPASTTVALLHHWREADDRGRALRYLDAAAREIMRQGSYREAVGLLEYGLAAPDPDDGDPSSREPVPRTARWRQQLGEALVALGLHERARTHLEAFLQEVGQPAPRRARSVLLELSREITRQASRRLRPTRIETATGGHVTALSMASAAYEQLGFIHYAAAETLLGTHAALKMTNLAEQARTPPMLARAYAGMSLTASVVRLRRLGDLYEIRAIEAARRVENPLVLAYVEWVAAVRAAGEGRWPRVESGAEAAIAASDRLGDHRLHVMSLQTLASGTFLEGDLDRTQRLGELQLSIAREHGNELWEAWALNTLSEVSTARGDDSSTLAQCERALAILRKENDRTEEIRATGMLALAALRLGARAEAMAAARQAAGWISSAQLTAFNAFEGYAETLEVALRLCEEVRARREPPSPELRAIAGVTSRALAQFAGVFPFARARVAVARARRLALAGHSVRARAQFRRAVERARLAGMPREHGLALLALGSSPCFGEGERRRALALADGLTGRAATA